MPKEIVLWQQHVQVMKGQEVDQEVSTNGAPVLVENWTLVFTDRTYGDQTKITFRKDTRDHIVRELMGGITLPGTI